MAMDFSKIYNHLNEVKLTDNLLEIGSDRGEGSTPILAQIALDYDKVLYSVDIDEDIIADNKVKYSDYPVKFFHLSGEEFLDQNKDLKFSLVCLDNFDWDWEPLKKYDNVQNQILYYKEKHNLEMNNLNSQKAHLLQSIKLTNLLSDQCIIVCDDTWFVEEQGIYYGKCSAAIPYLINLNFVPFNEPESSGVILIRN